MWPDALRLHHETFPAMLTSPNLDPSEATLMIDENLVSHFMTTALD
jgi:hypothetical protein